jgi:hypothetical protein
MRLIILRTRIKEKKTKLNENDYSFLNFLGKECKNICHHKCAGQWKGFGFVVNCKCECHNKKIVLGRDESLPNTINSPLNRNGEYVYQ